MDQTRELLLCIDLCSLICSGAPRRSRREGWQEQDPA